jgi:hypothetical protein
MTAAWLQRRYNDHKNDLGDWCPFSHCTVTIDADDRCPQGCAGSYIEDAETHESWT